MQPIFAAGLKAGLGLTIATAVWVEPAFSLGQNLTVQGRQAIAQTLAQTTTLTDLQGYWGQAYVEALAQRNYIGGFPDGTFRPNTFITRAQFAAIAAKALNLPAAGNSRIFVDVPSNFWAAGAIAAVSNAGLVGGFPDGTFRPDDRITRAQALVILTKALRTSNPDPAGLNRYGDLAAVPEWARDSIARAANAGIIVNFPSATLIEPNRVSTRGEVAALMYQTLYQLGIGSLPPLSIGLVGDPPPVGQNPQVPTPTSLSITEVSVTANRDILGAGEEIRIRAVGTPKAQGSFTIEGIAQDLPLTEQSAGVYVGSYTVRRTDNQAQARIAAKLSMTGAEPVIQEFSRRLTLDAQGPDIQQLVPANLALIPNRQPDISATLSDGLGSGVNPSSVRLLVGGQDVTAQSTITPNFIAYRPPQAFTSDRVNVELQAADLVGNANRTTWTFGFGTGNPNQPTTLLFPQLTNVSNNGAIVLPMDIVGLTAPNARVEVKVDAFTSLAGIIGVSQPIVNGQVQADSNGQFTFRLQSGLLTPSGTRYRVQLVAIDAQGQRSQMNEMFLVQQ
jgi:hypothetical protein